MSVREKDSREVSATIEKNIKVFETRLKTLEKEMAVLHQKHIEFLNHLKDAGLKAEDDLNAAKLKLIDTIKSLEDTQQSIETELDAELSSIENELG